MFFNFFKRKYAKVHPLPIYDVKYTEFCKVNKKNN